MKTFLKVKILSLWEEAKIIRDQEKKAEARIPNEEVHVWKVPESEQLRRGLYGHRKGIVAQEQRATLIAYGFLRGKELIDVEMKPNEIPVKTLKKVQRMVMKYGQHDYRKKYGILSADEKLRKDFDAWLVTGMEDGYLKESQRNPNVWIGGSTIVEFFRKESAKIKEKA